MTKKIFLFILMFSVALNYVNTADAKDKKVTSKNKSRTAQEKTDNLTPTPFNINTEKLPPNYKGTDIVKLFSVLSKKAPIKKDEFETTADYDKKIMTAFTTIADDVYAFKLDYNLYFSIHDYNADTQKLQIDIETQPLSKYDFVDHRASIIIKHLYEGSESHIGTNAFGANVLVKSYNGTEYGIVLVNQDVFGRSSYSDNHGKARLDSYRKINLETEVLPAKAKTMKNNIGVLLLCKPWLYKLEEETTPSTENVRGPVKAKPRKLNTGNSLIFGDYDHTEATFDSPAEHSYYRNFINVEVLSIWVYEINTGSIIFKKQLKTENERGHPLKGPRQEKNIYTGNKFSFSRCCFFIA